MQHGPTLLTGATGHVGANVMHRLLREGVELRCLVEPNGDRRALAALPKDARVEIREVDLRDGAAVRDAMRGITHAYHVAAKVSTFTRTEREAREIWDINVLGSQHVLRSAAEEGVSRIVVTGSFSATGFHPDDPSRPSREDMPFYPFVDWLPYARTKVLTELETWRWVARGLDAVIAVSTGVIGPWDYFPSRMGGVLCSYANDELRAYIDGGIEFVSGSDLAEGHLLAMQRGRKGEKYLLSTEYLTIEQVLDTWSEVISTRRRIRKLPANLMKGVAHVWYGTVGRLAPGIPQRLTPGAIHILRMNRHADISKAREELGYRPTSIRQALAEAYAFYVAEGMIRTPELRAATTASAVAATLD